MGIIKIFFLFIIFGLAVHIGNLKSSKYINRVKELMSIKWVLNILESKIKFTQTPLENIFNQIAVNCSEKNITKIFENLVVDIREKKNIHKSWESIINQTETNLNDEDRKILIDMGEILGNTDVDGQVSNIKITASFIDKQIEKAEKEKEKSVKLFRTLGIVSGLTIIIILV